MSRAAVVVFYRYTPRTDDHYRTQWDLFYKYAKKWYKYIDHLYIVDAGWNIPEDQLHDNCTLIREDFRSHCYYMNELFKRVSEDQFMLIDPDMLIYNPEKVDEGFNYLEDYGVAGILDNSGSLDLFPANELRDVRRRFTPYMTFGHTSDFKDRDFDWTQKDGKFEFDSMGKITFDLYQKLTLKELRDDRNTVYLEEDGSITESLNLDSPQYEWSKEKVDLGYYHVRNSSIGLSLLCEHQSDKDAYNRRKSITPFREMMRLLMWQWMYDKHTGQLDMWKDTFKPVLDDYGVSESVWGNYEEVFERNHPWLVS